jgi:hypothetical protein
MENVLRQGNALNRAAQSGHYSEKIISRLSAKSPITPAALVPKQHITAFESNAKATQFLLCASPERQPFHEICFTLCREEIFLSFTMVCAKPSNPAT